MFHVSQYCLQVPVHAGIVAPVSLLSGCAALPYALCEIAKKPLDSHCLQDPPRFSLPNTHWLLLGRTPGRTWGSAFTASSAAVVVSLEQGHCEPAASSLPVTVSSVCVGTRIYSAHLPPPKLVTFPIALR